MVLDWTDKRDTVVGHTGLVTDETTSMFSADVFKFWAIDRVAKQVRFVFQDGRTSEEPIADGDPILDSEIAVSIFDWEKWWVTSITR